MKKNMVKVLTFIGSFVNRIFVELNTAQIVSRSVSLILIAALLVPMFFFGEIQKVAASPLDSPMLAIVEPAPVVAAPEYYQMPSSGFLSLLSLENSPLDFLKSLFSSDSPESTESPESPESTENAEGSPSASSAFFVPTVPALSRARLSPKNATGGTNLYSRNFGWGTGLVGLPGRGLDAGFGISYNSLVWTKVGTEMAFNPDANNVTPGFQFGYPVIEPSYTDATTGKVTFLMVSPSGSRTEFRQVTGSTTTYETADTSYAQIVTSGANALTLKTTDGTQMTYSLISGKFRCTQIKDANGNFITISNNATNGRLQTVTDTLGRVITVNYDAQGQPSTITTPRNGGTYTFATFTYTNQTITTSFTGLTLSGVTNGASVKVLQKITYADGSYTTFEYNPYGQVWRINNFAADLHKLNHVSVNLSAPAAGQTDCPRFTETRTYAENYNSGNEVVIPNLYQEGVSFTQPGQSALTGTLVQVTAPDGTISKTYMMGSGWAEGLPLLTEDWTGATRQRWSSSTYTQDNTALTYILNPRVTESKVGDATNTRRTTIDYLMQSGSTTISQYGLPSEVKVYDTNQTTILKRSTTTYNLNTAYTTRRIIGLPAETNLFDGAGALMSKVTYQYDEGNFTGAGHTIAPINWDSTNYGASFIIGRGNLTSTTRWDVTAPTTAAQAVTSSVKYNTAGSPVSATDPLGREVKTAYTDSFDDNINRNTFAYPTSITDPANNSSFVKYKFELGANVWAQSPAPAGQTVGKTTSRTYDIHGRLTQETVNNTGAYTRYVYPTNGVQSQVYSTITDVNGNNTADAADEALSESFTDGAGRVRMSRTEHPGSVGGWSAVLTEYDTMGRAFRSTVPTEVNSSWTPAGDDAVRGFLWNQQEFDWKGRVTRQINTDGTDKLISYAGCGCAGGMMTTVQGELVPRDDQPTVFARRTQRVYEDILGRSYKTETLNWDGSIYATSKSFFNGRDQVTLARQYAGTDASTTFQDTTMTYDGHGRLKTQHRPEQDAGTNSVFNYFNDDAVSSVADARGASVSYTYNNRKLVTQISSTTPNATTIPLSPTVTYTYDNVGNRTQMTDGMGTVNYEYDQLSRLTAETRFFIDSLPSAPLTGNGYRLQYTWTYSGALKSYTDPWGQQINYTQDKIGRMSSVSGTAFAGVTSYASNPQYRAWGQMKHLEYGNNNAYMNVTYNNRLQPQTFETWKQFTTGPGQINQQQYQYYADGAPKYVTNLTNRAFDKLYIYDQAGRVIQGKSGGAADASLQATWGTPFTKSYIYNPFGQMVSKIGTDWTDQIPYNYDLVNNVPYFTYTNNRKGGSIYDANGNATGDAGQDYTYRSDGELSATSDFSLQTQKYYDGEGQEIKRMTRGRLLANPNQWGAWVSTYRIKSTVLNNQDVSQALATGAKDRTYVYDGSNIIATQYTALQNGTAGNIVEWRHVDTGGKTINSSTTSTDALTYAGRVYEELDTEDMGVRLTAPPPEEEPVYTEPDAGILLTHGGNIDAAAHGGCTLDGQPMSCDVVNRAIEGGGAAQCPNNVCGTTVKADGKWTWGQYTAYADGLGGFKPIGWERKGFYFGPPTANSQSQVQRQPPTLRRPTKEEQKASKAAAAQNQSNDESLIALSATGQQQLTTNTDIYTGPLPQKILNDEDCRFLMNELFGNYKKSVMAGYYNPPDVLDSDGRLIGGTKNNEITTEIGTHIYGGVDGSQKGVPFYIPANSDGSAPETLSSFTGESQYRDGTTATYITGVRTGGASTSNVFKYKNGLVIVANHIAEPNKNYQRGATNRQGSFQVGFIGGPGGNTTSGLYNHVHMSFYRYSKAYKKYMRVDPRYEFCSGNYQLK